MSTKKERAIAYYTDMLTIRRMEEKAGQMYQQGNIVGFLHLYIGQEAVAVGSLSNLRETDHVVTSYRDHAHAYMLGNSVNEVMAELFGRKDGAVGGKGGSMHFFNAPRLLGGHGIVGGQIPIGTGAAFSIKYQQRDDVSLCFFGDGALSQGAFFESINMASLQKLPVIYVLENNEYGMGTAVERVVANYENIGLRAKAFGADFHEISGMDVWEVEEKFNDVIASVRKDPRPVFIKVNTYRYRGHSISDPATYRSKDEVEDRKKLDPITRLKAQMIEKKWATEAKIKEIEKNVKQVIADSVEFASNSPWPDVSDVFTDIYKDPLAIKNYD
jgi:pyruvate dehydrogenase E1 component alpha subunit